MRVLVLGAGGIGGTIAGRLVEGGYSVSVCVRRIPSQHTVNLQTEDGVDEIEVTYVAGWQAADYDVVIVAVRPNQVETALAHCLGSKGTFVVCQNGLCEPLVRKLVGPDARVVGAVISWAASRKDGVIHQTTSGFSTLGNFEGADLTMVDPVCQLMQCVHPVQLTTNLSGVRWSKLALNTAASALCILVDGHLGRSFLNPKAIFIAMQLIEEVCAASVSAGVNMEPIAGTLDLRDLFYPPKRNVLRKSLSVTLLLTFALGYYRLESSMWRAMKAGELSGMRFLCGPVIEQGARGVDVRWSTAVLDVVGQIEAETLEWGPKAVAQVYAQTSEA
jgi:2-dehydropantoate 2-reductase